MWYNKYIKNLEKQGFFEHSLLCVQRPKNRSVVGSSPTGGAKEKSQVLPGFFAYLLHAHHRRLWCSGNFLATLCAHAHLPSNADITFMRSFDSVASARWVYILSVVLGSLCPRYFCAVLTAVPLVRVQQGEPNKKARFYLAFCLCSAHIFYIIPCAASTLLVSSFAPITAVPDAQRKSGLCQSGLSNSFSPLPRK